METTKKYWWVILIIIAIIVFIIYKMKTKKSCPVGSMGTYPNCVPIKSTNGSNPGSNQNNNTGGVSQNEPTCPPTSYTDIKDLWRQSIACAIKQIPKAQWPDAVKAKAISYLSDPTLVDNTAKMDAVSSNSIKDNITLQQEIVQDAYANATQK